MESLLQNAGRLVSETEVSLRKLIAKAAEQADYGAVQRLGAVAERLGQIGRELGGENESGAEVSGATIARELDRTSSLSSRSQRGRKRYPHFEQRNGALCKIGWSKKSKAEYEHRVPRETVERVVHAIDGAGGSAGQVFTVDDVVKQLNDESVPIYQLYVVIALLRDRDMLQKQGKDGYAIRKPLALKAHDGSIWESLKEG